MFNSVAEIIDADHLKFMILRSLFILTFSLSLALSHRALADRAEIKIPANDSGSVNLVMPVGCDVNPDDVKIGGVDIACEKMTNPVVLAAVQTYLDRVGATAFEVDLCRKHMVRGGDGKVDKDSATDVRSCMNVGTTVKSESLKYSIASRQQNIVLVNSKRTLY